MGTRVLMLEFSIYSVISPEGCASILFRDASRADKAAEALKLTARDLLKMEIVDEVIPEPRGGAHRDPTTTAESVGVVLRKHLADLKIDKVRSMQGFATRENPLLNPHSLATVTAFVEPALAEAKPGEHVQFERVAYFVADAFDSKPGAPVFNRTVTLRDTWAKIATQG